MNIIQKPSKNYNSRGAWAPNMIVNHITGGEKVSSALNEFTVNDRASAHFVVDLDGTIYQCVPIDKMAWGNGTSVTPSDNTYFKNSKLKMVRDRATNANLYSVSIEHVNAGGGVLTAPQLAASIELHKYIISEVKRIYGITIPVDRDHITGHCFINPITKPSCPGVNFPYDSILAGLLHDNKCDTSGTLPLTHGAVYQAKVSSTDAPVVTAGTAGVVTILPHYDSGIDHFYYVVATGEPGAETGIYIDGAKAFVVHVD